MMYNIVVYWQERKNYNKPDTIAEETLPMNELMGFIQGVIFACPVGKMVDFEVTKLAQQPDKPTAFKIVE